MTNVEDASTLQRLNDSTTAKPHRAFSFSRVLAITFNTLTELTRLRVFYVLLVFALLLIGSSVFMAQFSFQQEFQILKDVSLGAISIFTSLLAIVATARLLPQDIEDRTVYTILAKPVPRFEYVLGKIAGRPSAAGNQHVGDERSVSRGVVSARTSSDSRDAAANDRRTA